MSSHVTSPQSTVDRFPKSVLILPEFSEHGVYVLEGSVCLVSNLSSCQNNFPRDENQQHYFWLFHTVY
nr:hypothetical protein Iba_scaffold1676100CG0010 [Ipomoea batatas]